MSCSESNSGEWTQTSYAGNVYGLLGLGADSHVKPQQQGVPRTTTLSTDTRQCSSWSCTIGIFERHVLMTRLPFYKALHARVRAPT